MPPKYRMRAPVQCFHQNCGILLIYTDVFVNLTLSFGCKDRRRPPLKNVGNAIRLVVRLRTHISLKHIPCRTRALGITVYPQRVPVNPAVLERELISMAQLRLPSTS